MSRPLATWEEEILRRRLTLAEVRIKDLEALCAEAVLRQYSGEWPSWFTTKLSNAGNGKPIKGPTAPGGAP